MNRLDAKNEASDTALVWKQASFVSWSMTKQSPCYVCKVRDVAEIMQALTIARMYGLSVITHGAGHSYTDAALNTDGVIIDVTDMRRILSWDPQQGIMQVEPGATLRDIVRVATPDCWWPPVTPSTADATIGGCVAMNVHGKNAWKYGSFGEHLLSLTVLLASGQTLTLSPISHPELFRAFVGSAGLLGIITSVTLQLQRIPSGYVDICVQPAASLGEILRIFQEEQAADYLEAWVNGFASGCCLGQGIVTSATYSAVYDDASLQIPGPHLPEQFKGRLARWIGTIYRPAVKGSVRTANGVMYKWSKCWGRKVIRQRSLFRSTYYPPAVFTTYRALLPQGTETFQAFVPSALAERLFNEIIRRSQENNFIPLWCIMKRHRQDPFLLSYQVDGFSLEVNYQVDPRTAQQLRKMLLELMDLVIAAGGRFYLAKDSLLTDIPYRRSVGDTAVETFLHLKQMYDPEMLFQSDLFHRVFQTSLR
ncbi:FAD-binding oxidoreductase [Ktedonobacter robiniae]|uniref:FAD-binding oxidoreductase n=1 Tax=Ktedonobacter robiniae TaxID=2778365 RepID=UPI0027DE5D67|nr:FAD-binding oxidoreductase [Ktedonobacter robiniae]